MDKSDPPTDKTIAPPTGKPPPSNPAGEPFHPAPVRPLAEQSESGELGKTVAAAGIATEALTGLNELARHEDQEISRVAIAALKKINPSQVST